MAQSSVHATSPSVGAPPEELTLHITDSLQDLLRGTSRWDLWGRLGWFDVKRRYRRTIIGPYCGAISLDARFAGRAAKRLTEFISRASILVLASHSDQLVRDTCNKAAVMEAGRIVTIGPLDPVLDYYHAMVRGGSLPPRSREAEPVPAASP
ncbi:MAG: hypothetical protein JO021_25590 [Alphaproteobacteria bacterium]|nr:hypothetical protein [Alphaproteobacteria bacterium]